MKKLQLTTALVAMLLLLVCILAFAEETAPAEVPTATEQPAASPPSPEPKPASPEQKPEEQEPEQPIAPPAEVPFEGNSDEMPEEDELLATFPPEEEELAPGSNEEPNEEAPELHLNCVVRWVMDAPGSLLFWGDTLALEAELTPEMAGLQLQWQVATKPAADLPEDEPEWADIPGARGLKYTFTVEEEMRPWRWRLRVSLAEGDAVYSDEMTLPPIVSAEEDETSEVEEESVLGVEDFAELPVANITFTADVQAEEITYGTRIELVAEILHPRVEMLLQWQYMPEGEETWYDIPGATDETHAYVLDDENAEWLWRLLITVPEASDAVPDDVTVKDEVPTTDDMPEMEEGAIIPD